MHFMDVFYDDASKSSIQGVNLASPRSSNILARIKSITGDDCSKCYYCESEKDVKFSIVDGDIKNQLLTNFLSTCSNCVTDQDESITGIEIVSFVVEDLILDAYIKRLVNSSGFIVFDSEKDLISDVFITTQQAYVKDGKSSIYSFLALLWKNLTSKNLKGLTRLDLTVIQDGSKFVLQDVAIMQWMNTKVQQSLNSSNIITNVPSEVKSKIIQQG